MLHGFRDMLSEEMMGINTLFHQMITSYSTPNGAYFDKEVDRNCIVYRAAQEACVLWKEFQQKNLL